MLPAAADCHFCIFAPRYVALLTWFSTSKHTLLLFPLFASVWAPRHAHFWLHETLTEQNHTIHNLKRMLLLLSLICSSLKCTQHYTSCCCSCFWFVLIWIALLTPVSWRAFLNPQGGSGTLSGQCHSSPKQLQMDSVWRRWHLLVHWQCLGVPQPAGPWHALPAVWQHLDEGTHLR